MKSSFETCCSFVACFASNFGCRQLSLCTTPPYVLFYGVRFDSGVYGDPWLLKAVRQLTSSFFDSNSLNMSTDSMLRIMNPSGQLGPGPTNSDSGTPPASPMHGRVKAPPVCLDASLKETAMTTAALMEFAFESPPSTAVDVFPNHSSLEIMPVSSSSSTCTRESDTLSDAEGNNNHYHHHHVCGSKAQTPQNRPKYDRGTSERLNEKVSLQKTSRQGRSSQRWLTDSFTNETVRLVSGCVPILKGGKILLVSASRKAEWILPKGGWEQDESAEESAIRECFEEAGVLGILGPRLNDIQYETRKAKKRRLEHEELMQKKLKAEVVTADIPPFESAVDATLPSSNRQRQPVPSVFDVFGADLPRGKNESEQESMNFESSPEHPPNSPTVSPSYASMASPISKEDMSRIRVQAQQIAPKSSDETASIASTVTSSTYSQVRMTMFPLYVSEVHDKWPECGRFRKAVDIDEAIELMENRPEFRSVLEQVKERGLHLVPPPP